MIRRMLCVGLLFAGSVAGAQSFAVVSPDAAKTLSGQKDSAAAQAVLAAAAEDLRMAPHPMARVHTEGTLPGQGIRDESVAAERDFDKMLDLALAYRMTGEKRYLEKTSELLDAWITVYKVSGNPIDETRWQPAVLAFDLTRGDLAPEVEGRAVAFFRGMSATYLDWLDKNYASDPYNWSSHRVKMAVLGAYESGDATLIARAANAFRRQVKQNVQKSGEVNDFSKRDAMHYVTYDLEPLTFAALAAKAHGQDWFHTSASGAPSVEQAVDWVIPYATGAKTHVEFAHSTVAFDAARDKAGEKGYSGPWDPKSSVELFAQASGLDPKYKATLQKVLAMPGARVQPWLLLLPVQAR